MTNPVSPPYDNGGLYSAGLRKSVLDNDGRGRIDEPDIREYGTPDQLKALYAARAEARKGFKPVQRTKHVEYTTKAGDLVNYDYAPYSELTDAVGEALSSNGLDFSQGFTIVDVPPPPDLKLETLRAVALSGNVELAKVALDLILKAPTPLPKRIGRIHTIISHAEGGRIKAIIEFDPAGDIKGLGGQTTYLARYALQRLLGLDGDVDADGQDDNGKPAKVTDRKPKSSSQPPKPTEQAKPASRPAAAASPPQEPPPDPPAEEPPSRTPTLPPETHVELDPSPAESRPNTPKTREQLQSIKEQCRRLGLMGAAQAQACRNLAGCEPTDLDHDAAAAFIKALESIPSPEMAQRVLGAA